MPVVLVASGRHSWSDERMIGMVGKHLGIWAKINTHERRSIKTVKQEFEQSPSSRIVITYFTSQHCSWVLTLCASGPALGYRAGIHASKPHFAPDLHFCTRGVTPANLLLSLLMPTPSSHALDLLDGVPNLLSRL
jgi:hypothetical protein